MKNFSAHSTGKSSDSYKSKNSTTSKHDVHCSGGYHADIHIDCRGDVHINNCSTKTETDTNSTSTCPTCFPLYGACLPVVPGAKHKLNREYKLANLADRVRVPSAFAAGAVHMLRRFLLDKSPANPLEAKAFATLGSMSRDLLSCTITAFDAIPSRQRNRLFAPSLLLDTDQPLDETNLSAALAKEIVQRVGIVVFDDPHGAEGERPGRVRVFEPEGEFFFDQVRICTVNGLRTSNFIPFNIDAYLPADIQQDCETKLVDGQPQVICQVRTADCPGNSLGSVCARVPDVALGDGVVLQGVNYFSLETKVRFTDKQTGTPVRDVDAHVFGDIDTPVTEVIDGDTRLINDCRVHDRLTFRVPDDLVPALYQIQVVVPNITGISSLGNELISNIEYINVITPATARFQIVTESLFAREETSPAFFGSDEVGLRTMAFPIDLNLDIVNPVQIAKFEDIQDLEFDTGTFQNIEREVFKHDQPISGMVMTVLGYEIDSRDAFSQQITSSTDIFIELVKQEVEFVRAALEVLGIKVSDLTKLGPIGALVAGIAAAITLGIDLLIALWAPADLIIQDTIALSVSDLARLTSVNAPAPDPTTFTTEGGIVVNVNKTTPPIKLPTEYHETREYVSDDQESRYEITYRFQRVV